MWNDRVFQLLLTKLHPIWNVSESDSSASFFSDACTLLVWTHLTSFWAIFFIFTRDLAFSRSLVAYQGGAGVGSILRTDMDGGASSWDSNAWAKAANWSGTSCFVNPGFAYTVRDKMVILLRKMRSGLLFMSVICGLLPFDRVGRTFWKFDILRLPDESYVLHKLPSFGQMPLPVCCADRIDYVW